MSVLDHLRELRRRVITVIVIVSIGAVLGWVFYDHPILSTLKRPYCNIPATHRYTGADGGCDLVFTEPLGGFAIRLKVSIIAGAVLTAPFWLYQVWAFITPGLRRTERRYTIAFVLASTVLFLAGAVLAYAVLSKGLQILIGAAGSGTIALLSVTSYLNFVTLMLVVFGAAFELPLIVVMANLAGVLPSALLRRTQRLAIFLIFLFAAVATPSTDPFTMCAMAVPMVLLYEGAVLFATIHDRRKAARRALERAAAEAADAVDDETPSAVDPLPAPLDPARERSWTETT